MKKCKRCTNMIIIIIITLIFFIYGILVFDTNSVVEDFLSCVNNQNIHKEVKNTELYQWYNYKDDEIMNSADVEIRRRFTFHNFKKGIMYINYTYQMFDKYGNVIRSSHNINSIWHIEKRNGRWYVVEIDEGP